MNNLLVTTLGMSWQIVPELFGFTNPDDYDFFKNNAEAQAIRERHYIEPVEEVWAITVGAQRDLDKLQAWAAHWQVNLRIFICKEADQFATQEEILKMRSFIYRVVLHAREACQGKLYLSLSGGRKTMSADMQEAGNLFGCAGMFHVVDCQKPPEASKKLAAGIHACRSNVFCKGFASPRKTVAETPAFRPGSAPTALKGGVSNRS